MSKIHKNRTLGREGKQQQQIIKIIIKKKHMDGPLITLKITLI